MALASGEGFLLEMVMRQCVSDGEDWTTMKHQNDAESKLTGLENTIKELLEESHAFLNGAAIDCSQASHIASKLRLCAEAADNLHFTYSAMCLRDAAKKVLKHAEHLSLVTAMN